MLNTYRKVASTNMRYQLKNQLFVKRSQYIRIENPLHERSEKAWMCFNTRRASTRDYTVCELNFLYFGKSLRNLFLFPSTEGQ